MAVNLRKQDFESDTWRLKSTQDLCKLQLMKKTGAIKWLQWAGIPYTIARREQDSGIRLEDKNNDVLDSATCMESLDTISYHFEWEFYEYETWMIEGSEPLWIGYGGLEGYGPIRGHLSRLFHWQLSLVGKGRLKIPNEWKTEMQSETGLYEPRRYMQSMAVRCAHATNAAHARWDYLRPAPFDLADNPSPDYPMPDLREYDSNRRQITETPIESTLVKILSPCGPGYGLYEKDVKRHINPMLAGIFDVPRCDLYRAKEFLSSTTLTLPNVYYSPPDFAAQVSRSNFSTPTSYRPVVLVGDANHELPGIWEVSMRGMAARLAHAVQPTLQMFMIDLTTRYRKPDGSWDPTWDPFESAAIPEHMIVYGIAYDEFGVVIYAFFPRYVVDNDTRTLKWGCGCYEVATEFRHHLQLNSMFHRAQLFRALLTVLEEARKASEKFSSPEYQIKCPPELLDLDKEWARLMGIEA